MTLTFRTEGPWGPGKGGNLTPGEVDDNFWSLKTALDNIGDELVPAEIDNITLTGNELRIFLEDGREFGPFLIPRASFRWRETFEPGRQYFGNDVFEVPGQGIFLVLKNHTSESPFDPGRTIDSAAVYQRLFASQSVDVVAVAETTFTPQIGDESNYFRCTNEAGCAVTIPDSSEQAFAQGTELHFRQAGAASVLIEGDTGVTINGIDGFLNQTAGRGAVVTVKKVQADAWDVFGYVLEESE